MESPEQTFFKYAFPCSTVLLNRGRISQEKHDELAERFEKLDPPPSEELEKIYVNAARRMRVVAEKLGRDAVWDRQVILTYFLREHNRFIQEGDGEYKALPPALCEVCKVRICEVEEREKDVLTVRLPDGGAKKVMDKHTGARPGEKVSIHWGFACDIIDDSFPSDE